MIDTLQGSSADSTIRRTFAHGLADGQFPDLSRRNMIKDLEIISELAMQFACDVPHALLSLSQFRDGIASGIASVIR